MGSDNFLTCRVCSVENISENTFLLSLERNQIEFIPGQYMILRFKGELNSREYSIYNEGKTNHLQFLIREVRGGSFSTRLRKLRPNDCLELEGPYGFFVLPKNQKASHKFIFITSGTGISPVHSMIMGHPEINYKILHGIRHHEEKYHHFHYKTNNYHPCISGISSNEFHGRVTDYSKTMNMPHDALYYLSGNSEMIYEMTEYLLSISIPINQIHTEIYF